LVVSNSSPLIYLAALGDFELLRILFDEITIPQAVFEEVVIAGSQYPVAREVLAAQGTWMHVQIPQNVAQVENFQGMGLDPGESAVLALAQQVHADGLLLDDADAIHSATRLSLNVIRTPGVFRMAKEKGLISAVRPKLDALRKAGFWLRDEHFRLILERAGESFE
jgi:predicted nucleic acid-binding protein